MDVSEVRTANMRRLIAEAGGPAEWTRKFAGDKWSQAQVSQWNSERNPKRIGEKLARQLEIAQGLAHGVLDQPPQVDRPQKASATESRIGLAYKSSNTLTQAAIDLLLLPQAQRAALKKSHPLAHHAIELLEEHAQTVFSVRKSA